MTEEQRQFCERQIRDVDEKIETFRRWATLPTSETDRAQWKLQIESHKHQRRVWEVLLDRAGGAVMSHDIEVRDYWGLCPRCCRESVRRDVGKDHFMCCDHCRVYWKVGRNLFTPYKHLVLEVVFDDEIGGEQNREVAAWRHEVETRELLSSYEAVALP